LTHYQRQRGQRVRSIDTRRSGAVDVQVVLEALPALHREHCGHVCRDHGLRLSGARAAKRFYKDLQELAEPSFGDHSFIHLQEAANRLPRP
jgi:hypothetical protein